MSAAAGFASTRVDAPGARWVDDLVALRALRGRGGKNLALPDVDFGRCGVLCVRTEVLPGRALQWQPALWSRDRWVVRLRPSVEAGVANGAVAPPATRAWIVPRPQLPIEVELGIEARGVRAWSGSGRLEPQAPAAAQRLLVLRCLEVYDSGQQLPRCQRIDSPDGWRELQRQVQLPSAALAAGWVDFTCACVVVVATGSGRVWPGFDLAVAQEEGVDVLTLLQQAPSGRDPGVHTPLVLVQLPRRPRELAVVLRLSCGPAPAGERTLGHFDGLR